MARLSSSKIVIYAALSGNLLIAVTKFAAAGWTGSSAMLSEGVHSLVDTGNQALMLYGIHRSMLPPDADHPLGYGRELYFWSFIVALLIFALGAGISIYEGVVHIQNPSAITDSTVNYVVLGLSFVFESATWFVAWREFSKQKGSLGVLDAVIRSRDPTTFLVLFEDSAALLGILIAFAGTLAAQLLEAPIFDGVASIGIGLVLAATALFLARESKGLLIGEPARREIVRSISEIAKSNDNVSGVDRLVTVHLAPNQIVVALDVEFMDNMLTTQVEEAAAKLESSIKSAHPDVIALFLHPKKIHL